MRLNLPRHPNETLTQWRSRCDLEVMIARKLGEPTLTDETRSQGFYEEIFVTHVETNTKAKVHRNRRQSGMAHLHERGILNHDQYAAALDIARIVEVIGRNVTVRCASLEARVDQQGSARSVLFETLAQVRLERTYTAWRAKLPMPKRLVIDLVLSDRSLKATARGHHVSWVKAKVMLIRALDCWLDERDRSWREVDIDDALAAQRRVA